jgi:predicted MPP superfamily phosphohydrolase
LSIDFWLVLRLEESIEIRIPGLPKPFDGLRIAQLSDIHSGSVVAPVYIDRCLKMTADLKPDLILLTGDYVTGQASYIAPVVASIHRHLTGFERIAVLGNHDYWADAAAVRRALTKTGTRVLGNESHKLVCGNHFIWIAGVHDYWSGLYDPDEALRGLPKQDVKIVLSHNPDTVDDFKHAGVDLLLTGHTHGGQVNLPFIGPPIVPSRYGAKYASGLFHFKRMSMYVNRGIGVIRPPVRFRARPEITHITLRAET